jgi:hypothetical protein
MQCRFFLDVVVSKSSAVFQLLTGEDKSLLVRWDTFLVLNLGFYAFNRIGSLNVESDCLAREGLDKDLHI